MRKCLSQKKQHFQKSKIKSQSRNRKNISTTRNLNKKSNKLNETKYKKLRVIQPVMHFSLATAEQKNIHYQKYNCRQYNTLSDSSDSKSSYTVYEYEEEDIAQDEESSQIMFPSISTCRNFSTTIEYEQRYTIYHEIQRIEQARKRIYLTIFFNLWKSKYQTPQDILVDPDKQRRLKVPLTMVEKYTYSTTDSNYDCDQDFCDDLNFFRRMKIIKKKYFMNEF